MLSLTLKEVPSDFYRLQDDIAVDEDSGQSLTGLFSVDMGMGSFTAVVILLVLFIIGSGCLLIYNILYISVTRDTRFYGLLKQSVPRPHSCGRSSVGRRSGLPVSAFPSGSCWPQPSPLP